VGVTCSANERPKRSRSFDLDYFCRFSVILSARSLASMRGWRRNILTVNLLFCTIVFAVTVKLHPDAAQARFWLRAVAQQLFQN
jgi:hypothetical protein